MHIHKIAAFTDGDQGGNPAGVVICEQTFRFGLHLLEQNT